MCILVYLAANSRAAKPLLTQEGISWVNIVCPRGRFRVRVLRYAAPLASPPAHAQYL